MIDFARQDICRIVRRSQGNQRLSSDIGPQIGASERIAPCIQTDIGTRAESGAARPSCIAGGDKRAAREIADCDTVIFADGEWTQPPRRYNAPDITEEAP